MRERAVEPVSRGGCCSNAVTHRQRSGSNACQNLAIFICSSVGEQHRLSFGTPPERNAELKGKFEGTSREKSCCTCTFEEAGDSARQVRQFAIPPSSVNSSVLWDRICECTARLATQSSYPSVIYETLHGNQLWGHKPVSPVHQSRRVLGP